MSAKNVEKKPDHLEEEPYHEADGSSHEDPRPGRPIETAAVDTEVVQGSGYKDPDDPLPV